MKKKDFFKFLVTYIYIYISLVLALSFFGMHFMKEISFKTSITEIFTDQDALFNHLLILFIIYIYIYIIKALSKKWFISANLFWTVLLSLFFAWTTFMIFL